MVTINSDKSEIIAVINQRCDEQGVNRPTGNLNKMSKKSLLKVVNFYANRAKTA